MYAKSRLRLVRIAAVGAQTLHLEHLVHGRESQPFGRVRHDSVDIAVVQLQDGPAAPADQELALVRTCRVGAADEGIERGDAVYQAVLEQEIQRAVDRGRRGAAAIPCYNPALCAGRFSDQELPYTNPIR